MTCPVCGAAPSPGRSWWVDGYELTRCAACDLVYRRTLPNSAELVDLYAAQYFRDGGSETDGYADYVADAELHRSLAQRRLERLEAALGRRGRLLDVGAAAGFFVAEANARGWQACGVDIAPEMIRYAAETLRVRVSAGRLQDVEGETFDAVTMWDYIEHSVDPAGDVDHARRMLSTGGILALSTGDIESLAARVTRSRWHLLTPRHHNFFFSRATITMLLEAHGLEVLDVSRPGARYSVSHLAYKLQRLLPGKVLGGAVERVAGSRLGGMAVPVNLFDIVTVTARKA